MESLIFGLLCFAPLLAQSKVDINVATLQKIHSTMDRRVSPCSNFWAYACGNWSSSYMDNFELAQASYAQAMIPILRDYPMSGPVKAPRLLKQMRDYFNACAESRDAELQLPEQLFTGHFEWTRATARLRKYGLNGVFFDEAADVAFNDSLRYVVQLKMPELRSDHFAMPHDVQQLDAQLRELCQEYGNEEGPIESWTLGQLKREIPQVDWQIYFEELLEMQPSEDELRVEVSDVDYLRELGGLLQRSNKTRLEIYLRARLAKFAREAYPSSQPVSSEHFCVHQMRALLPLAMNYVYDRYVYRTRAQDTRQLQAIFARLRGVFGKYLEWNRLELSLEQLHFVHAKLANMQLKLGNLPDPSTSDEFYDSHYASARFSRTDTQHNLWEALRLRTRLQHAPLLQLGATLQLNRYYVNDDVFSARDAPYFEHERNTLTVPLIFMQWPFYDYRQDAIFRHSLMGFILAHELSHAFEHEGILFDAAGNESPIGLRIRQHPRFQSALQCVQQRGTPTASLKERLADVNGLQLAYDALFGVVPDSARFVHPLHAIDSELFHLNFAQFFCGRLPTAINHDMDDVRVNEAEKNLRQFSMDFKCRQQFHSIGCEMWRPAGN